MATESFEIWTVLPVSPEMLYAAWLDAAAHSAFTGMPATAEPSVGSRFTAFGDYIEGTTQELEPGRRILQTWRTTEFSPSDPDSTLEVVMEPHDEGTRLILRHSNLPEGQGSEYESGWERHYFEPMKRYFTPPVSKRRKAPAKKSPVQKKPKKAAGKKAAAGGKQAAVKASARTGTPKKSAGKPAQAVKKKKKPAGLKSKRR
jgi:uncharacterized protein YndB with AHSA1/START domain